MGNPALYRSMQDRVPTWARGVVMAGLRGSHVHGTYIAPEEEHGTDDTDTFQVIAHPRSHYVGLDYYLHRHEVWDSNGVDLDILVYELVKFIALLAKGNPNVNLYLWLQPDEYLARSAAGDLLISERDAFVTRAMFPAFGGYAFGQLKRMTHGEKLGYMGAKRKLLMDEYGYDIKNASHCVRLFYTAIHLALTGQLLVRLSGEPQNTVLDIKRGKWSLAQVEKLADDLDQEFAAARAVSRIAEEPDPTRINSIVRRALERHWEETRAA